MSFIYKRKFSIAAALLVLAAPPSYLASVHAHTEKKDEKTEAVTRKHFEEAAADTVFDEISQPNSKWKIFLPFEVRDEAGTRLGGVSVKKVTDMEEGGKLLQCVDYILLPPQVMRELDKAADEATAIKFKPLSDFWDTKPDPVQYCMPKIDG